MNHRRWAKRLSAYLDNELSMSKKAKMEKHLNECSSCRETLKDWTTIKESHTRIASKSPREQLWQGIILQMRTTPLRPLPVWEDDTVKRWLPNPITAIVTATVAILIVVSVQPYFHQFDNTNSITVDQYLTNNTDTTSNSTTDNLNVVLDISG